VRDEGEHILSKGPCQQPAAIRYYICPMKLLTLERNDFDIELRSSAFTDSLGSTYIHLAHPKYCDLSRARPTVSLTQEAKAFRLK